MDYFPAFLRIEGKPCLLVGGGGVAARKARLLLSAGAKLTVVAPVLNDELAADARNGRVRHKRRRFHDSDIDGQRLVVSATGNPAVERRVSIAAERAGVFCNAVDDRENCSFITPAIVDRSPIMVAVSSGGAAPVLARRIRTAIESQLSFGLGDLAKLAGRWRQRVGEALPEFARRLRFWEWVFDGPVAAAVTAGDRPRAERLLATELDDIRGSSGLRGEAWLVGAGPGDPGLLTLKALQVMQRADVILHDRLVSDQVLDLARRDAERISVGKAPGWPAISQDEINALLLRLVSEGKRVCRLKGGDPFVFGRGGEEAEALEAAGLPFGIVPGITAAAGCAAAAGIPLTHRDAAQSLVLLTAHGKNSVDTLDWPSLARDRQTLAIYMGVRRFEALMTKLITHGRATDTPIAIIERGTTPEQRVVRGRLGQLKMLADLHRIRSPAILLIGDVAAMGVRRAAQAEPVAAMSPESAIQRLASC